MKIKCSYCRGTGKISNSRCSKCNGYRICDIEPLEFIRQNRTRVSKKLPKLEKVEA